MPTPTRTRDRDHQPRLTTAWGFERHSNSAVIANHQAPPDSTTTRRPRSASVSQDCAYTAVYLNRKFKSFTCDAADWHPQTESSRAASRPRLQPPRAPLRRRRRRNKHTTTHPRPKATRIQTTVPLNTKTPPKCQQQASKRSSPSPSCWPSASCSSSSRAPSGTRTTRCWSSPPTCWPPCPTGYAATARTRTTSSRARAPPCSTWAASARASWSSWGLVRLSFKMGASRVMGEGLLIMFGVVVALPVLLAHSNLISIPAMVMSVIGGLLIYGTIISFAMFFQEEQEF